MLLRQVLAHQALLAAVEPPFPYTAPNTQGTWTFISKQDICQLPCCADLAVPLRAPSSLCAVRALLARYCGSAWN